MSYLSPEAKALLERTPDRDGIIWLDSEPPFRDTPAALELRRAGLVDIDAFAMTLKSPVETR